MKWQRTVDKHYCEIKEWHKWFAWFPVRLGETTYWLEAIERKWTGWYWGWYWIYREPQ